MSLLDLFFPVRAKVKERRVIKQGPFKNSEKRRKQLQEAGRRWRAKNKEAAKAYGLKYYWEHREESIARSKKWRDANKAQISAYKRGRSRVKRAQKNQSNQGQPQTPSPE